MFVYSRNRMECLTIRPWNSSFSPLRRERERERERETEGERDEERERPVFGPNLSPIYGYVGLFSKWQSD